MISLHETDNIFFIGIAGTGMSALAQWLAESGKNISGSDRYFKTGLYNDTRNKLEAEGIKCFLQDGEGITQETQLVIVSTAIEDTVYEVQKAKSFGIPIMKRSELLALIASSKKTIAVGGTSGKSTTSAMIFDILDYAGYDPGIISGAGLIKLIRQGKIGNAKYGSGEWLVIEADESDGSIVQYQPEIGLLLNIDKDHKTIDDLVSIFKAFKNNTKGKFIVNRSYQLTKKLSSDANRDFSVASGDENCGYIASGFAQEGLKISFAINAIPFELKVVGKHNMENALAAVAVASEIGIDLQTSAQALREYKGIYRRHEFLGEKHGVLLIDDYAHNPVKCAVSIQACQPLGRKVIAWFQPHGYAPTKFLKNEFIEQIANALRPEDEIWMSEIFYAGGTTTKDISAGDLIEGIKKRGKNAYFVENRNDFFDLVKPHLQENSVLLLMGARDPSLSEFAQSVWKELERW